MARSTSPTPKTKEVKASESRKGKLFPNTHLHRVLGSYRGGEPVTDWKAMMNARLHPRSGAWHRSSDLRKIGAIKIEDEIFDLESGKFVRRCRITTLGRKVLRQLDAGKKASLA